jgi:hypothetical protein
LLVGFGDGDMDYTRLALDINNDMWGFVPDKEGNNEFGTWYNLINDKYYLYLDDTLEMIYGPITYYKPE